MDVIRINLDENKVEYAKASDNNKYLCNDSTIANNIDNSGILTNYDPLSSKNKLILEAEPIGKSDFLSSTRFYLRTKSPLSYNTKKVSIDGNFGFSFYDIGVKAIVLEGKSDKWQSIYINKDGVKLIQADAVMGMGTNDTIEYYSKKYEYSKIITIGPAGEKKFPIAGIDIRSSEGLRYDYYGKVGFGAVMGSKNIKAILINNKDSARDLQSRRKGPSKINGYYQEDKYDDVYNSNFKFSEILSKKHGIKNQDIINKLDHFCIDYGIECLEFSDIISVAIDAGVISHNDEVGFYFLKDEIINDTLLGKILVQGEVVAAKVLGV